MTDPRSEFISASVWHGSLERCESILAAHPEVAGADVFTAAILGDDETVRRFIAQDPGSATTKNSPLGWDALTHLCFSRYLRLDRTRSERFVRAATALLDAGASANTGFSDSTHQPNPEWESALYGAAGVAHHEALTRLLVERGADPNDNEVPYHTPETYDNGALRALVESGRLTDDSLTTMLLRKADWHDTEGIRYLLEHGANPNRMTRWKHTALHQAVRRDNGLEHIEAMLQHGGDATLTNGHDGRTAIAMAARRGRADILELLEKRGVDLNLNGVDRLIAACARNDEAAVRSIANQRPELVAELLSQGGTLLAEFAGNGNADGVRRLLGLGVPATALYEEGDGYFEIARRSTVLHVAAWRAHPAIVRLLIEHGAQVNAEDGNGRTPLALAVRACIDSYWMHRRTPESVQALLGAGASVRGVSLPTGYAEVDELLKTAGRTQS